MGFDAQFSQQREYRAVYVSIALEFYYHEIVRIIISLRLKIMEVYIKVDGQALSLGIVDERDTVKPVLYRWFDIIKRTSYEHSYEFVGSIRIA